MLIAIWRHTQVYILFCDRSTAELCSKLIYETYCHSGQQICICLQYLASSGSNVQWSEFQQGVNFYGYVLYQSLQHKNDQVGQVLTSSSSRCNILLGRKEGQSCQNSCCLTRAFSFVGFCKLFNNFPLSTLTHLMKSRSNKSLYSINKKCCWFVTCKNNPPLSLNNNNSRTQTKVPRQRTYKQLKNLIKSLKHTHTHTYIYTHTHF